MEQPRTRLIFHYIAGWKRFQDGTEKTKKSEKPKKIPHANRMRDQKAVNRYSSPDSAERSGRSVSLGQAWNAFGAT